MKKIFLCAVAALALTSCASNGWSCKNRYCENEPKTPIIVHYKNV